MAKGNRGGKRASGGTSAKSQTPTQAQLKNIYDSIDIMWDMTPQERLSLAKQFSTEKATKDNFFENSIGEWDLKKSAPRRQADYVSYNRRTGKISSQYWYTDEGVYRKSDHWGSDVASCSWYIKGRKYKNDGVSKGKTETAFISWDDLYAKGMISKHYQTGVYSLVGFSFKK